MDMIMIDNEIKNFFEEFSLTKKIKNRLVLEFPLIENLSTDNIEKNLFEDNQIKYKQPKKKIIIKKL